MKNWHKVVALAFVGFLAFGAVSGLLSFQAYSVAVDKQSPWIIYHAGELDNSGAIESTFEAYGWTIQTKISCGSGSYAADAWYKFTNTYGDKNAIVVIGADQTPIYTEGPKFWGDLIHTDNNAAGTIGYVYKGDTWINGNDQKYSDNHALVKFLTHQGRTVIICWTGARFDTGDLRPLENAWRWVAGRAVGRQQNWLIFDHTDWVDHQDVLGFEPPPVPEPTEEGEDPVFDTTPPTVTIESPSNGAFLTGMTTINIKAVDDTRVSKVEIFVRGEFVGNADMQTSSTFIFEFNTSQFKNGEADIRAKATDYAGNSASNSITVTLFNAGQESEIPFWVGVAQTPAKIQTWIAQNQLYAAIIFLIIIMLGLIVLFMWRGF